jgi:uncharacterized protein YaiL (DUF2058 family)
MRNALHEQLLKAGLINEQRLQEVEREKQRRDSHKTPPRERKHPKHATPPAARAEPKPQPVVTPKPPSKEEQQAARRALEREIAQLIKANRQKHNDGDEVFNFVDGKKIGRIYVTPAMHASLTRGEFAIVRLRTRYAVVTPETAQAVAARAPEFVIWQNSPTASGDDSEYKDHPVPDDLRW